MLGELSSKRARKYIENVSMSEQLRRRLLEYQILLVSIRAEYPRLHPTVTHYAKAAMHPEERRYRYAIARAMGVNVRGAMRVRDWREHTFFRYLVEWNTNGCG